MGYDEQDLSWAQDLAHRIGLNIENRRLYAQARELFEQTVSANFVRTPERDASSPATRRSRRSFGFDSIDDVLATQASAFYQDEESRQRSSPRSFVSTKRRSVSKTRFVVATAEPVAVSVNAVGTFTDQGELFKITGFMIDRTAQRDHRRNSSVRPSDWRPSGSSPAASRTTSTTC